MVERKGAFYLKKSIKWLVALLALLLPLAAAWPARAASTKTISTTAKRLIKKYHFSGTVLVVKNGKVVYQSATGYSNAVLHLKNTTSTAYGVGSLTKSLTAQTLMTLVKQGKVSLNDKLSKYYPHIKNADKVTLRQVLNMVSGIETLGMGSKQFATTKQYLNYLAKHAVINTKPINQWHYSSVNYSLLAGIIEQKTGLSYQEAVMQRLAKKVGVSQVYFSIHHLLVAQAYRVVGKLSWFPTFRTTTSQVESLGAGEVYMSPLTYYKIIRAEVTGKLIGAKRAAKLYGTLSPTSHYTAGFYHETDAKGRTYYHAHGRSGSYEATVDISSDGKYAVIAMTNNSSYTKGTTINHVFEDTLYQLITNG